MNKEFNIGDIVRYFDRIDWRAHNGFIIAISVSRQQYRIRLFEPTIHSYGLVWVDQENLFASIENTNE